MTNVLKSIADALTIATPFAGRNKIPAGAGWAKSRNGRTSGKGGISGVSGESLADVRTGDVTSRQSWRCAGDTACL
jgi:hypothetical protein